MQLNLTREEVESIILAYGEQIMPGKFNTVIFKTYGHEIELVFIESKSEGKKENERNITNTE